MGPAVRTKRSWTTRGGFSKGAWRETQAVSAAKGVREKEREREEGVKFILHAQDGPKVGGLNFSKEELKQTGGSFLQVMRAFAVYVFTAQEGWGMSVT